MSGENKCEKRQTRKLRNKEQEEPTRRENSVDKEMLRANTASPREGLTNITRKIRELKQEMKNELTNFKEEFKTDFRQELNNFQQQTDSKLSANSKEPQGHKQSLTEAQTCIQELEEWNTEVKEVLLTALKEQRHLKEKLIVLEGRSRRNSLCIFGIPKGAEGDSVPRFVDRFVIRMRDNEKEDSVEIRIQGTFH